MDEHLLLSINNYKKNKINRRKRTALLFTVGTRKLGELKKKQMTKHKIARKNFGILINVNYRNLFPVTCMLIRN